MVCLLVCLLECINVCVCVCVCVFVCVCECVNPGQTDLLAVLVRGACGQGGTQSALVGRTGIKTDYSKAAAQLIPSLSCSEYGRCLMRLTGLYWSVLLPNSLYPAVLVWLGFGLLPPCFPWCALWKYVLSWCSCHIHLTRYPCVLLLRCFKADVRNILSEWWTINDCFIQGWLIQPITLPLSDRQIVLSFSEWLKKKWLKVIIQR